MKSNLTEINSEEALQINGGGLIKDIYDIILAETDDFVKGFKNAYNNGVF